MAWKREAKEKIFRRGNITRLQLSLTQKSFTAEIAETAEEENA